MHPNPVLSHVLGIKTGNYTGFIPTYFQGLRLGYIKNFPPKFLGISRGSNRGLLTSLDAANLLTASDGLGRECDQGPDARAPSHSSD